MKRGISAVQVVLVCEVRLGCKMDVRVIVRVPLSVIISAAACVFGMYLTYPTAAPGCTKHCV